MNESFNKDSVKYALGILILLAFILILGIYLLFLGRFSGFSNGAGLLLAGQGGGDTNARLSLVQSEIEETLARVKQLEDAKKTTAPSTGAISAAPKYLKISKFAASQTIVPSGSRVTFSYAAVNTERGASFRLLIQCPTGVTAIAANGANVCRRTIAEALPIDNSGTYTVNLTNAGSEPGVIIAALLASDITDNSIFFRDSRVLTVTVSPSGNGVVYGNTDASIFLTNTPSGAPAPATISFTATLNSLDSCADSHWDFGDGYVSEKFAVCPNSFLNTQTRTVFETHQYNQPGTYVATFYAGGRRASNNIYISAPTTLYTAPPQYSQYIPTYYNPQPIYTYTQPPVYNYVIPSLPDVPTAPTNFRAVSSGSSGTVLSWSAPTYGNVVNYTIYRRGGNSLDVPIVGSPTSCGNTGVGVCFYTVSGNAATFTDTNTSLGNTYTYRIVASNGYGTSNFSDPLTVGLALSNSPSVPRTFTATASGGRIILNWSAPASGNASSYTIYRKGGGTLLIPVTFSPAACNSGDLSLCYYFVGGQTFTLTDSNLSPNTAYTYRIIAGNSSGSSEYSEALTVISGQGEAPVPTPTLNPANRVDSLGLIQLSWNSVGASYYRVYRSANRNDALPTNDDLVQGCASGTTNPCFLSVLGVTKISSTQAVDNQYDPSKSYYYRVKAYSSTAASNWSNEVSALANIVVVNPTPAPLPTPLPISPSTGGGQVTPDPVIISFLVNGQTAPTVSSGSMVTLTYSGSNVSSYKLYLQCPANVMIPDPNSGANLCRTSQANAVPVGQNSVYFAIYNMSGANQSVSATLLALRADGSLSNSVARTITVRPQSGF